MNQKEEMLNLINRLAQAHESRAYFVSESKDETRRLRDAFQQSQDMTRCELESNAKNLHETLTMEEGRRLKESARFNQQLCQEQKVRTENTRKRMSNVNCMLGHFNDKRMHVKQDLDKKAEDLKKCLALSEENRLDEFKQFQDQLDAEATERVNLTTDRREDVDRLRESIAATQAQVHKQLNELFENAQEERKGWADDRQEIRDAWRKMTLHKFSPEPACQTVSCPPPCAQPAKSSCENAAAEHAAGEGEESPAPDQLLQVKATLATFAEGCRFNELYRNMQGMSKSQLRSCLAHLLKAHELRRDAEDHYHLT